MGKGKIMTKKVFLIAIMLLTTFGSTTYGQDSNSAPNLTGQIEEILVTATRRTETDILTTPIPMTALNDTMIEKYAPRDLQDMALMTPGLSAGTVSAFKSASFSVAFYLEGGGAAGGPSGPFRALGPLGPMAMVPIGPYC